jgi:hypothetical protein
MANVSKIILLISVAPLHKDDVEEETELTEEVASFTAAAHAEQIKAVLAQKVWSDC